MSFKDTTKADKKDALEDASDQSRHAHEVIARSAIRCRTVQRKRHRQARRAMLRTAPDTICDDRSQMSLVVGRLCSLSLRLALFCGQCVINDIGRCTQHAPLFAPVDGGHFTDRNDTCT